MISCGTTSKVVGKKSRPCWRARASMSAMRSSNMGGLLGLQKGLQHLIEFFLVRHGDAQQAGMGDLLQHRLQRTQGGCSLPHPAVEAGVVAVADFAIPDHGAVGQ